MKPFLNKLIILLALTSFSIQAQERPVEYRVINILGAKMYELPNLDAAPVSTIKFGASLTPDSIIPTTETRKIGENFSLSGNWVATGVNGSTGYVFSSDLSDRKIGIRTGAGGQERIDFMGDLVNETSETIQVKMEQGTFPKYVEIKRFENGTYKQTSWDGCFDHEMRFKGLNLNEVYHQMISEYGILMNGEDFQIPGFKERDGNQIKFETEGASMDLQIELLEDDIIQVSSYDCT